ncbi:unnamed protein product [marine sediment metagenome]|uniref:Uncharacterized protein n=1 Tax=marine sediment metagenome TaxID=412755 RepID=X0WLD6_9ZZZZ
MKQITVNNNTYNSISAAWRAESPPGLPMITVRWRLNNGWIPWIAFRTTPVTAKQRRMFKGVRGG